MSHLVGASLLIPGNAWRPRQDTPTTAVVLHFARPTRGYPEGRIRILCDDGTDTWWDVSKLVHEWITAMPDPASTTPTTRPYKGQSPNRGGRRSTTTTPGSATRRRTRRRSSRAGDGYDSGGAGVLSDGEGVEAGPILNDKLLDPAGPMIAPVAGTTETSRQTVDESVSAGAVPESPTAIMRQRNRPRKSLRFAPGTVSPGSHSGAPSTVNATGFLSADVPILSVPPSMPSTQLTTPLTSPRGSEGGLSVMAVASGPLSKPGYASSPPRLSLERRLRNTLIIFLVMLPAFYFYRQLHYGCHEDQYKQPLTAVWRGDLRTLTTLDFWCAVGYQEPLLAVNLVFLLNVGVLFWLISLLQGSTWLIDPFWTVIPILIGIFYQYHPAAISKPLRSRLAMGLLWVWAVRLTHSYFRREEWQIGAREDWRYARMAQRMGRAWWAVVSLFAVGVTQQLMLVGITLPLLAIHTSLAPWNPVVDTAIFASAATGIMIALVADNQLRDFTVENEKREQEGRPRLLLLDTGLWRYSRHPNFFGEQLWWWSLGMWAVLCGQSWMLVGAAFNTLCFIPITRMTEERMLERPERASLYRQYQRTTSVWIPWPKRALVS